MMNNSGWNRALTKNLEEKIREEQLKKNTKAVKKSDWSNELTSKQQVQRDITEGALGEREKRSENRFFKNDGSLINENLNYQQIINDARASGDMKLAEEAKVARFQKLFGSLENERKYRQYNNGDYQESVNASAIRSLAWAEEQDRIKKEKEKLERVSQENAREIARVGEEERVLKKYGFSRESFSDKDMEKWASEHNYVKKNEGYVPKEKGIKVGPAEILYGNKIASEEEQREGKILLNILSDNMNRRLAEEHPALYSVGSIAGAPIRAGAGAVANLQDTINEATGKPINVHSQAHRARGRVQEGRELISDKYASKWFGGKEFPVVGNAGEFLYNTMMSAGDSGMNAAVGLTFGGAAPAVTSFLMANDAAASQVVANKQRGLSDKDALTFGLVSGAVEMLTEKMALDEIMKHSKTFVTRLLKGFVTEGIEEMTAETINTAIDSAFMGDDSQIAVSIKNYINEGMSEKDATIQAITDSLNGVLSAGIAGGISGVGIGGIYGGVNAIGNKTRNSTAESGNAKETITNGEAKGNESSIKYKIADIVGKNKNYGKGVYLDGDTLQGLDDEGRKKKVKEFVVENLAGETFIAYDNAGNEVDINIVSKNAQYKNSKGKNENVLRELYRKNINSTIKQEAVILADELIASAKYERSKTSKHPHDWIDNYGENDWDYWNVFLQEKDGSVWEATLNIANTENGEKILYDISPIKKVEDVIESTSNSTMATETKNASDTNNIVPNTAVDVNSEIIPSPTNDKESIKSSPRGEDSVNVAPGIRRGTRAAEEFSNSRPRYFEVVDGITKKLGVTAVIDEDIDGADGYYDPKTKELHINLNSENPVQNIVKHEITHILEGNKKYAELTSFVKESFGDEWEHKRDAIYQKYEKKGIKLSPQTIDAEVMAEFAENMRTDAYIERVSNERPGLVSTVRNFIREIINRFKGVISERNLTAWEQAERKWGRALEEVAKNGALESDEGVRYKLSDNARTEVRKALNDKNYKGEVKLTENSPAILLSQKGVKDLPMVINASHLRENIFTEAEAKQNRLKVNKYINYHGLGEELFLNVIDGLDEVAEAYRGTKNAENPARRENYFLLISQYTDKDGNVINVPVYVNEKGLYNRIFIDTNKIATVFGRDNLREYINRQLKDGNLVRIKKGNIRASESTSPINADYETNVSNNSIRNIEEKVKEKFESRKIPEGAKTKLNDISGLIDERTEADVVTETEMRLAEVEKENRAIRDLNTGLRSEIQKTKDWKINPARVEEAIRKVKDAYVSKINIPDVAAKVQEITERLIENGDAENFDKIYARSFYELASIGEEIAEASDKFRDTTLYEQYAGLRKFIKDTPIKLSDKDKADVRDYEAFRKRNFGKIRLSNSTSMSVDSFYEELVAEYPEWFSADVTHPADRLLRIEEVLGNLQPTVNNMAVEDSGKVIAAELLENLLKASSSDQQAIVDHLKKGYVKYYQQKNEELRAEYSEKLKRHRGRIKDRYDRETLLRLVNEFSRIREDLGNYGLSEIMKGEELEAFYFEDATDADIEDLAQRMLTPSEIDNGVTLEEKKAEVREKIKQAQERQVEKKKEYLDKIEKAINELDGMGLSILEKGYVRDDGVKVMGKLELNTLKKAYESEKKTLGADFVPNKRIEDKITRLDRKQISDMDIADVQDLIEVMQAVKHAVQNENRMLAAEKNRKISETAEKVRGELEKGGEHTDGLRFIGNIYNSWALTPIRRARQMVGYAKNSEFVELFKKLNEGSRKALRFKQNTSRTFEELVARDEMKKFAGADAEVIEVATESGNIKITPALRVSLYLHNKNFDNLRHIFYGGIVIPDAELLKKGKFEKAYEKGQTVKLTRRDINKICKGMSAFELEFAEKAGKWLDVTCKEAINETSNILLGYDVARVKNYMPLATDPNYTKTELLVQDGTLEGMGMLKNRAGGINPIYLMDILRVIENQNEKVAKYSGLAVPVRDLQAVYNQQSFGDSTKATIEKTWGKTGKTYIENLLKDLQGGRKKKSVIGNLRGKYAAAVLNLNIGTVFGQASGYPVIANTLGWKSVLKALGQKTTETDKALRSKYTPEFWMREKGYTTAEMGEYAQGQKGFFDNLPKGLDWLTAIDCLTTGKIWKAAEVYVNDEIEALKKRGKELPDWAEVESDAYYKRIAEMHDKAMEETQPVYNTMQQPDLLRSDNELVRSFTMFMSQRLQNYGAVYDALGEYRAAKKSGDEKWIKEAGLNWGRAVSAQIVSAMVYSAARFAGLLLIGKTKKYEDEEEEKITKKSLVHGYALEVLGTIASGSIGGSEVMNLIMSSFGDEVWYGIGAPSYEMLDDITSSTVRLMNRVRDDTVEGTFDYREYLKPFKTLATDLSKFTGVPVSNIMDIATGIGKNSLEAARRFAGTDTTNIDWQLMRLTTPLSTKSEYKKFLGKIIKEAYYMADGEGKKEKYARIDDITKDMVRIFGEEKVEEWQNAVRKDIYKERNPENEMPESEFDIERNKYKEKPEVTAMSDEFIEEYGVAEITYDGKKYKLTEEQTKSYKDNVEDKKSDYYDKIIGDNININEAFNGVEKHTSKTSESKERKVKDYFYYLADCGEITESEAESKYKQYLHGEIEVPVFDVYTLEYMTYDELSRSQRESVIDDKKKELRKGTITKAEYDSWYKDFVDGKVTYQKQKIIYGNYNDLDDEMKSKVLTKIQNKATKEAQEEMKNEVVGK